MSSDCPTFGAILVGDELLSGRRQDKHLATLIGQLAERGLELAWARMVGDDFTRLSQTIVDSIAGNDIVFCYGGIGATPDDCTRQAAAQAAKVAIERHPEGADILINRYGGDITDPRLAMVDFPQGARLIPNPINEVPGFSINRHHFVPGFPNMATPMVQWVLDNEYPDLQQEKPMLIRIRVDNEPESRFVELMETTAAQFDGVKVSSLPNAQSDEHFIEFGLTGIPEHARAAQHYFVQKLQAMHVTFIRLDVD